MALKPERAVVRWTAVGLVLCGVASLFAQSPASPDTVAWAFSRVLAEAIPRHYERQEDWGNTKRITVGLDTSGGGLDMKIRRRKKEVPHGVWKQYRVDLVNPDELFEVRIENLRSLEAGQVGFTVFVTAKLRTWAQAKVYNRGIHLIALTAEGDAKVKLWLDCVVSVSVVSDSSLPGLAIDPHVVNSRLKIDDFRLHRVSKLHGTLANELGDGLKHLIEDELNGPKLTAKLNRAIDKKRDRLKLTPDKLLHFEPTKLTSVAPSN